MIRGVLLIALAAALWATTAIVAKFLFTGTELAPVTLGFLRLVVAVPCFGVLMLWELRQRPTPGQMKLSGRTLLPLLALGVFQALYQGSYLLAVDLTGAGIATLIALCLAPVLVALAAAPILGEKPGPVTLAALAAAIAGTSLLVFSDYDSAGEVRAGGITLAIVAAFVYAGFSLTSRHTSNVTPVFTTAFICFLIAALVLFPVTLASGGFSGLASLAVHHWLMVLYVGIVPTCLGYLAFFTGMRTTPATTSTIIVTLEPLFVAALAWLFLGEILGVVGVTGAIILTIAVIVASGSSARQQQQQNR